MAARLYSKRHAHFIQLKNERDDDSTYRLIGDIIRRKGAEEDWFVMVLTEADGAHAYVVGTCSGRHYAALRIDRWLKVAGIVAAADIRAALKKQKEAKGGKQDG